MANNCTYSEEYGLVTLNLSCDINSGRKLATVKDNFQLSFDGNSLGNHLASITS